VSDVSQYPLTYEFLYNMSSSGPSLNLASSSELTYSSSVLPQGYESLGYVINSTLVVSDSASAKSYAYQAIIVRPSANINFSDISIGLNLSLSKYFMLKAFSGIISAVNVVATTVNYANCSGALNCTGLNRGVCLNTPHTCSACIA
jgi:REJ domain